MIAVKSTTGWIAGSAVLAAGLVAAVVLLLPSDEDPKEPYTNPSPDSTTHGSRRSGDLNGALLRNSGASPRSTSDSTRSGQAIEDLLAQFGNPSATGPQKNLAQCKILEFYAAHDPDKGIEWLNSLDPLDSGTGGAWAVFGLKLGQLRPAEWVTYYRAASVSFRSQLAFGAVCGMAKNDGNQAWETFQSLAEGDSKLAEMELEVFDRIAASSGAQFWEKAIARANEESDELHRADLIARYFASAKFEDPNTAITLLVGTDANWWRSQFVDNFVGGQSTEQLTEFGEALLSADVPASFRDDALEATIDGLYHRSLRNAALLLGGIEDSALRDRIKSKLLEYAESKGGDVYAETMQLVNQW